MSKIGTVKSAVEKVILDDDYSLPSVTDVANVAGVSWSTAKNNLLELEKQGYISLDRAGNTRVVSASAKLLDELGVNSDG